MKRTSALAFLSTLAASSVFASSYTLSKFDIPGIPDPIPWAVNDSGQIVGQYNPSGFAQGFLYDHDSFTTLSVPGSSDTLPLAINDKSQVVGSYGEVNRFGGGFVWQNGSFTLLDFPGGAYTTPSGINDGGVIVGSYQPATLVYEYGFIYSGGKYTTVKVPGAYDTFLSGINDSGQIVGFALFGNVNDPNSISKPFFYKDGVVKYFSSPSNTGDNTPAAISNSGLVTGSYSVLPIPLSDEGSGRAYVLKNGVYTLVWTPEFFDTIGAGINDSGLVVGRYVDQTTTGIYGFIASPVPEPNNAMLLAISLLLGIFYMVQRRKTTRFLSGGTRQPEA